MKLIPKEKLIKTPTGETLYKKLLSIWDNEHFIIGVFATLKTDEQKLKLLDFIEDENITDDEIIVLAAGDIANGIEI